MKYSISKEIIADLHNHSTFSDGEFSPEEILNNSKSLGLKAISLTDHDTLKGLKTAIEAGKTHGVEVIPGVEISVRFTKPYFKGTLHLLCYFLHSKLDDKEFTNKMEFVLSKGRGESLVRARISQINRFFGPSGQTPLLRREMEFKDIAKLSPNATRRHFAQALHETFRITDEKTIHAIMGNGSPAYVPSGVDLEDVKGIIRSKGVLCALAHPAAGSFPGAGHYKEVLPTLDIVLQILPEFLEAGIHGLEVYYPGHTKMQQGFLKELADAHHLVITGGSDSHDRTDRPAGVEGLSESEYNIFKAALT